MLQVNLKEGKGSEYRASKNIINKLFFILFIIYIILLDINYFGL